MAERPRELDQRFQGGGGQFEAKLQIEGLLFALLRHDASYAYDVNQTISSTQPSC